MKYVNNETTSHTSRGGIPTRRDSPGGPLNRYQRLAAGNPGDVKAAGEGVSELRIDYGPGYRVYYQRQGRKVVILLAGGDKHTQAKDIKTALRLARNL